MKKLLVLGCMLFATVPALAQSSPHELTFTEATAVLSALNVQDVDTDGEKVGFIYTQGNTANEACRFAYGDKDGFTTYLISAATGASSGCSDVDYVHGTTWIAVVRQSSLFKSAISFDSGQTWEIRGTLPSIEDAGPPNLIAGAPSVFYFVEESGSDSDFRRTIDSGVTWSAGSPNGCPINGNTVEYVESATANSFTYLNRKDSVLWEHITVTNYDCTPGFVRRDAFNFASNVNAAAAIFSGNMMFMIPGGTITCDPNGSPQVVQNGLIVLEGSTCTRVDATAISAGLFTDPDNSIASVGYLTTPGTTSALGVFDGTTFTKYDVTSFMAVARQCRTTIADQRLYCFYLDGSNINFIYSGPIEQELVETVPEPSEFDAGLKAMAASLGFRTPESQMLFVIILTGVGIVVGAGLLKWFPQGRWRNYSLLGLSCIVGAFGVILQFIQLWAYTLALVLGATIVSGGKGLLDTWGGMRQRFSATESAPPPSTPAPDPVMEAPTEGERDGA